MRYVDIVTAVLPLLILPASRAQAQSVAEPIAIGESLVIRSAVLDEDRRINVYIPPAWGVADSVPRPVLYMPDGGVAEDFIHIAGLLQVSVMNGTVKPVILVGIENTERRRDMTGTTAVASDSTIAPRVGGSAQFRQFIRDELIPLVESSYPTTTERGIIGESLAGLFVVETFLLEPELFDHYIAIDPSLWWNDGALMRHAPELLRAADGATRSLYLANSSEPALARLAADFAAILRGHSPATLEWTHRSIPDETHGTIYHPAALSGLRTALRSPD